MAILFTARTQEPLKFSSAYDDICYSLLLFIFNFCVWFKFALMYLTKFSVCVSTGINKAYTYIYMHMDLYNLLWTYTLDGT